MRALAVMMVSIAAAALLAACGSGPVRRVSEPAARIQQLTVGADGRWSIDLRIENYSSVPMRFERVSLALEVAGQEAGTLDGAPAVGIGPESADVVTLALSPSTEAKIAVADALASGRSVAYRLQGRVDAIPEDRKLRSFDIERSSALNPAPGLPGVMR
ncbi:LEA type 2 family protein [Tolypothrix campylonemoides VB511288]|nr:LEA type 2 family protein [Tolypothrix campylonemoides VB511288]